MKIPSIIRIPRHQRFHIEPRYYDPVKEEIEQRTSRIKKELEIEHAENELNEQDDAGYRIARAFSGRIVRRERNTSGIFQFLLMIVLFMSFIGYLYLGNVALYFLGLFMILFVYMKFRKTL
mgnify:CR=1 FL=1